MRRALLIALLLAAGHAALAQEPSSQDATLLGMRLGKTTLQDVLSRFGLAPLRHGDIDELCYRSESPFDSTWVLFGSGARGDWETLTQFRMLSTPPADITCRPTPLLASGVATDSGIRIGMPAEHIKSRIGRTLRVTMDKGRVTSYEVRLTE